MNIAPRTGLSALEAMWEEDRRQAKRELAEKRDEIAREQAAALRRVHHATLACLIVAIAIVLVVIGAGIMAEDIPAPVLGVSV